MGRIKAPSYLVLRGNTYHFRLALSQQARIIIGKYELGFSLRTGYLHEAVKLARDLADLAKSLVKEYSQLERKDIEGLIPKLLKQSLDDQEHNLIMSRGKLNCVVPGPQGKTITAEEAVSLYYGSFFHPKDENYDLPYILTSSILSRNNINLSNGSYGHNFAIYQAAKHLKPFLETLIHRTTTGDYGYVHSIFQEIDNESNPIENEKETYTLQSVFDKYCEEKMKGAWTEKTMAHNVQHFEKLLKHCGNQNIHKVSKTDARNFKEKLLSEPKKIANGKTLAPKTVNDILGSMSSFFNYAMDNGYVDTNPFKGVKLPGKDKLVKSHEKFSKNDFERIFDITNLEKHVKSKHSFFWVMVLALYTGCRLEELSQLHCTDIKENGGIFYIHVRAGEGKRLKNKSSERKVPLHPFITDTLKFLTYVDSVRERGEIRIFPDLTKANGNYGHSISKWFNRTYLPSIGVKIDGEKKTFHSFRHTFNAYLQRKGVPQEYREALLGHKSKSINIIVYGEEHLLTLKKQEIEKLNYDIDLGYLVQSEYVPK